MICGNCKWFVSPCEGEDEGECHYNPPNVGFSKDEGALTAYPSVAPFELSCHCFSGQAIKLEIGEQK